jgi:ABC-2 type transport system permease protein
VSRAFRSEWLKIRRPAMLFGGLGVMVAFAIVGMIIGVLRADNNRGALTIFRLSQPDGFAFMLQRTEEFLGIVALGWVAVATAQEYASGTLRNLLVREPRRLRLLAGKTLANLLYIVISVAIASGVALAVALIAAPTKGIDTSGWLHAGLGDTVSTMGNLLLAATGFGVFGALLALVLRSQAAAVIAGLAWILPVENLLTAAWTSVGHWLPGQQLGAIAASGNNVSTYGWALGLGAAFVAAAVAGGGALFKYRDVAV